jgi:fluoride ion exporter CrcB/FEX
VATFDEGALPPLRLARSLLAVGSGGALGTLCRTEILNWTDTSSPVIHLTGLHGVAAWSTTAGSVPWGLLAINTFGVFLAAWLLGGPLHGRSPDDAWRLFAITGILGGLTSYSGLIRDVASLNSSSFLLAFFTLVGAVGAGLGAAIFGVRMARK